jgi:DNA-binding CsgD family transcriptional regulator
LSWTATPKFNRDGAFIGSSAIARDITSEMKREVMIGQYSMTSREADVFRLAIQGVNNLEIATRLGIREATVKFHLNSIFKKTRTRSRHELMALARD